MKTNISEELPARKYAAAAPSNGAKKASPSAKKEGGGSAGPENSEKRIRQAVYDIRYRARREDIDLKQAFAQYMSNSSLSQPERTAVREKLFGKKTGVSEQYSTDGLGMAVDSIATALYKVFVEGVEETIELEYQKQLDEEEQRVYHVRVTDPKNGRTYTRNATREKITQLRAKGLKVEMSEYRDSKDKSRQSKKTGNLDPVGREDSDVDNDGKPNDSNDRYIMKRRAAIGKAIATRKEDYLWTEGTTSVEGQNKGKITGTGVDNSSRIRVFPSDGSNPQNNGSIAESGKPFVSELTKGEQKFFDILQEKKMSDKDMKQREKYVKGMKKKKGEFKKRYGERGEEVMYATATKMAMKEEAACSKCGKSPCECDMRDKLAYRELLKNKMRSALGVKQPCILDMPEDEKVMKIMTSSSAKMNSEGYDSRYGRGEKGEPKATEILKLSPKAQEKYDKMMDELRQKSNIKGV